MCAAPTISGLSENEAGSRACEVPEGKIFDRSGPFLDGHPALRRSPVRDGFKDQPVRKNSL